jgi:hypothetical protein
MRLAEKLDWKGLNNTHKKLLLEKYSSQFSGLLHHESCMLFLFSFILGSGAINDITSKGLFSTTCPAL